MREEAQITIATRGAACAFEAIYEEYLDRIYAYLRVRTASTDDARDLTQQVFLQALEGLPRFRGHADQIAAWLFRIARNAVSNHLRRRRPAVAWDLVPEALQPRDQQTVDARLVKDESLEQLRALLQSLAPDAQELLALRFVAQLTVAEIATLLGKSDAAVSKQLSRTIHHLQEEYHGHA
jgi:RNA polymerase sigma-70 factor (ECF subfamily)